LVGSKLAPLQFGWSKPIRAYARNCMQVISVIARSLNSPAFE